MNIRLRRKRQQGAKTVHTLPWVSVFVRTNRQVSVTLLTSYVCAPHLQQQHAKQTKFITISRLWVLAVFEVNTAPHKLRPASTQVLHDMHAPHRLIRVNLTVSFANNVEELN